MFSWNFAKSAEAILSRYAIKRLCKFLLKKKLGKFINGDIDLDQLDVQLSAGLLQLTDLALNVEYLNQKLGQASIFRVKEGSIRSLLVKMPWNGKGCEVEMDELELVLFPCCHESSHEVFGIHDLNEDYRMSQDTGVVEHNMAYNSTASINVHEGVKTVAKMVKWLLTSFCIRIKSVIVAFDAGLERDKGEEGSHDALVLRVAEIECGACISEDGSLIDGANAEDFLGISHLTTFLKVQGATVELLQMNSEYNQTQPAPQAAALGSLPNASKLLLTGERGGFCGTMKLSIPLKNGSLDTCKVNAEINVDPLIAKLQPSTLKWILVTWELLENYENNKVDNVNSMFVDTNFFDSTSQCCPSTLPSSTLSNKYLTPELESSNELTLPVKEEMVTDVLLKESRFISDWVPFNSGSCEKQEFEEANLGASVDQFFECLDEMRSSQLVSSSGMWGWTCSVFNAITATTNLASGSLNVSAEQQLVQTNLKITLVGISTILAFSDEDLLTQHKFADEQVGTDFDVRHLGLVLQDVLIDVQVYSQEWRLETTVKRIVLDDLFSQNDSVDLSLYGYEKGLSGQTLMIRALQDNVLGVLPSHSNVSNIGNASSTLLSTQNYACGSNIVKATLFETFDASHCLLAVSSIAFDDQSTRRVSFSLKLPPFILWMNFDLVNVVLDFSSTFINFARKEKPGTDFSPEAFKEKYKSSPHRDVTSTSLKGSLGGSIFLPHAKVIICFPFKCGEGFKSYISCDQFIALDFSSPSNFTKLKAEGSSLLQEDTSWKKYIPSPSHSVQLNVVNLDVYHIISAVGEDAGRSTESESQKFCSHKILALGNGTWVGLISMLWQEDAVTGPWITKIAKILATSDGSRSKMSSVTSDYEFTSVSTRNDKGNSSSQKQKKLVLSSKFCVYVCVPAIVVTLHRSQYLSLFDLLSQAVDALSSSGSEKAYENRRTSVNQSSFLVECCLAEIHIELDQGDCLKSSLQRELPGSWNRLRLEIQNLQFLSVSDVGAISGASFCSVSHREGKLFGSITAVADQDVLLISCCDSSNGRGDGEGSNVLSCGHAGFDFVYMSDPEIYHNFMLVSLTCGTIVAPGGRLDWMDKIFSFFSLPSSETGHQIVDCDGQKGDSDKLSFVLKFIDVALSYEPYFCGLKVNGECFNSKSRISANLDDSSCDRYIACLLAASSLTLSSTIIAGSLDNDYSIRFRDVGLLLHEASNQEKVVDEYNANNLHELGYVKVAGEALVDAILRINCDNDIYWELNCSQSHVVISTCHDTTLGLIRLASQLQQLFAPDMEESLVHLQNRWNSLKQVQGEDDNKSVSETSSNYSPRALKVQQLGPDSKFDSGLVGLMDAISEDAFLFSGKPMSSFDRTELSAVEGDDRDIRLEGHSFAYPCCGNSMDDGHSSKLQNTQIMEGYCLSGLRSLSELTIGSHFPEDNSPSGLENRGNVDVQRGKSGWYGSTSLRILENYVPDRTSQSHSKQHLEGQQNYKEGNGCQRLKGRLLLKNVDVKWQMYAGSDWHSADIRGRNEAICLELALSNMNIRYDIFPDGDLCVSKLCLSIQDLHLYDKSRNAPWKLVLGYYFSKERPRQSFSKAFKLDLEAVRPDPMTPLEEYRLCLAVLPILLHLHQSQLDFLISFFGGNLPDGSSHGDAQDSGSSDVTIAEDSKSKDLGLADEALLPYFQKFDIRPIILRVDYNPSRVDLAALSGGKYVELVNLVPWKGIELHLKPVQAAGVYGWSNVCETTLGEWLEDISQNQIHKLLQGLPTIHSLVAVGSSAAKLVSLPVKNYRKDHRLVKGLQRGTVAFLRSISVEALGLGVHLAAGAHEILVHAECIVTRIQPSLSQPTRNKVKKNRGSNQPVDAEHGLRRAYETLSDGLGETASALIHTPMKTYQRGGGASSAIVSAVRGAPRAAIAPVSAAVQAVHCTIIGVRNSLDPDRKEKSLNKYLGPSRT